jgi:RNA polymerase sigma-70 factor (ECF subfamily)
VSRFASIAVRDRDEADDIAQEALLRAIARLHQYDATRGTFQAWLWRIVVNEARDTFRRSLRRRAANLRWAEDQRARLQTDAATIVEDNVALHSALARLRPRDRELLGLRFGADLDLKDVAAAVGLSVDSCGRAVRRAVERLRGFADDQA